MRTQHAGKMKWKKWKERKKENVRKKQNDWKGVEASLSCMLISKETTNKTAVQVTKKRERED